jgi:hypothetical protein
MHLMRWLSVSIVLLAAVLPGDGQDKPKNKQQQRYQESLYPIKQGFRWIYRVTDAKAVKSGTAGATEHVIIAAASEQTFGIKKKSSDGEDFTEEVVGFNLQVTSGGKGLKAQLLQEQVVIGDDGVYRVSGAGKIIVPPLRFLKSGAKKGDTWKVESQSENAVIKGEFTVDEEVVKVPLGEYKAIVVRARDFQIGSDKMQVESWFSANVGMVKQRVQSGNHDVTLELEKIEVK